MSVTYTAGWLTDFARALHEGQRYGDRTYGDHLWAVADCFEPLTPAWKAALFHDAIEDGKITFLALALLIGHDAAKLVEAVTRREGERYREYIQRVAASGPQAVAVKLAVLRSNLAANPRPSLRRRYERAVKELEKVTS